MRQFLYFVRFSIIGFAIVVTFSGPAHALLIEPTFGPTLTSQPNAAALEAAINNAVETIDGLYSNPGTVQILYNYNSGVLGETQSGEAFVSYSQYTSQLAAVSAANPQNSVLATAVANIAKGNTADYVLGTTAFLRVAMNFTGPGTTPCYDSTGTFVNGCNQIYDNVITIGNVSTSPAGPGHNSQAVAVVEHETDEALGGGGTGTTIGENLSGDLCPSSTTCSLTAIGPTDFYRYESSGSTCADVDSTPSYTTSSSAVACYSIDGGKTALVQMNQAGGGSDYGDFVTPSVGPPNIQDAFYGGTTNDYTDASPEFIMMQSIGYDAPEPSTLALFASAIGGLGWMRRRRARSA
jgi:hypothetical protein